MLRADGEGLEVVPLVLDFRTIDALEAEPGHDLLDAPDRLRDRVHMPETKGIPGECDVDRGAVRRGAGKPRLGGIERCGDRSLDLVEEAARLGALSGIDPAEEFLDRLESPASGPGELDPGLLEEPLVAGHFQR